MGPLEFMSNEHFHVILHSDKKHALIFNRLDDTVATVNYDDAKELTNLSPRCRFYGLVGRFMNKYLILIKNRSLVGLLYDPKTKIEHEIYVITQVQVVDVSCITVTTPDPGRHQQQLVSSSVRYNASTDKDDSRESEKTDTKTNTGHSTFKHQEHGTHSDPNDFSSLPITISTSNYSQSRAANWNPFKIANSFKATQFLKSTLGEAQAVRAEPSSSSTNQTQGEDADKRLVEEMVKLFNNTNSFYFCPTLDLTNRFSKVPDPLEQRTDELLWTTADERFFWNKHMLKDLADLSQENYDANYFICVIMQGFIAIEHYTVPPTINLNHSPSSSSLIHETDLGKGSIAMSTNVISYTSTSGNDNDCDTSDPTKESKRGVDATVKHGLASSPTRVYHLALISRRSVFHAGTRYRRRGCDDRGNVANYVETEQIFRFNEHFTSVVLLRGSIPLYWYQHGFNYRPPPVLFKSEEENQKALEKHFQGLVSYYDTDRIIAVDCTEQTGREKNLHDAFRKHMLKLNESHPNIKLIQFDFHKHCHGRQCTDLQVERHLQICGLTEKLIKESRYYWNDGEVVWKQSGVYRVNCLDCSDRTNVVQRAIALRILDNQLERLGIIIPDTRPEDNEFRKIMQIMWSTNGNVLSTQYCGTRALFTGDKKLAGYLKDTYSSASRYYISKFRDVYRQAAIDAMLGVESDDKTAGRMPEGSNCSGFDPSEYAAAMEPLFAGKTGSALLKDVGNKVSNRLARLKGRFHARPLGMENIGLADRTDDRQMPGNYDSKVADDLNDLNIDWPANDDSNDDPEMGEPESIFAQFPNNDECYQDDEFGQLVLSIDIAELQRMREVVPPEETNDAKSESQRRRPSFEEIHMRETSGQLKTAHPTQTDKRLSSTKTNVDNDGTSTTSA